MLLILHGLSVEELFTGCCGESIEYLVFKFDAKTTIESHSHFLFRICGGLRCRYFEFYRLSG
jgi:hypothetical protein